MIRFESSQNVSTIKTEGIIQTLCFQHELLSLFVFHGYYGYVSPRQPCWVYSQQGQNSADNSMIVLGVR